VSVGAREPPVSIELYSFDSYNSSQRDYGPGIQAELLEQIGHSLLRQTEYSMGLGPCYYWSALAARYGWRITLSVDSKRMNLSFPQAELF